MSNLSETQSIYFLFGSSHNVPFSTMAFPPKIPHFYLFLATFYLSFLLINSLSTVSISYISNQTIICALIPSCNQQSFLNCTSFPSGFQIPVKYQTVPYNRIVGGKGFLCALRSSNSVMECWRFIANGSNKWSHKRIYRGSVLGELEAGNSHVCGLVNGTNDLKCWQWSRWNLNPSPQLVFSSIAVGEDFVCGLNRTGNIICLGDDESITVNAPSGNYSVIAAGPHHACAISLAGSLACWGNVDNIEKKPEGRFMDLAMGDDRSCALHLNKTAACWGSGSFGIPTRLQETYFVGIVAKQSVFCGVLESNYSLMCWGSRILDGNLEVFPKVMPGSCTSECPLCGPLPVYGEFCRQGLMVCQPCAKQTPKQKMPPQIAPSLPPSRSRTRWSATMVVLLLVGCLGSVSFIVSVAFWVARCYGGMEGSRVHDSGPIDMRENPNPQQVHDHPGQQSETQNQASAPAAPVLEKRLSHMYSMDNGGNLEEFPLEVLLEITNNFSQDRRMGIGSFGSVYHGTLEDGREVAIKRAEQRASTSDRVGIRRHQEEKDSAFMAELELLSRLNHKHLVRLYGFYEDANEMMLVYEFMKNGTLHDHLHKLKGSSPLASWPARLKVALDAARGIEYLHQYAVPPIIHRDIKPSNILLDSDWTAKVSDFGLSLMGPQDGESHISLRAAGTFGYVDPEYYRLHLLTTKSDVFSFGVVLLELLTGYKAVHTTEDGMPRNVVDFAVPYIRRIGIQRVLDPQVPPPSPVEIEAVTYVGYLAVDCVSLQGQNRPSMSEVVNGLETALVACLAQPVFLSSSSSNGSSR